MVQVQQESFFAIEETESNKIVIEKCQERPHGDIQEAESDLAFGNHHLRAERRVAVHVLDVIGDCRVGVVDDWGNHFYGQCSELDIFMDKTIRKFPATSVKQPQLGVGPVASVPNPPAKKHVLARNEEATGS